MLGLIPLDDAITDVVLDAYREIGLRVVFSPMVWDVPPIAMVRDKDDLPPDVQEMLGTTGRPVQDQFDYLEHQFKRHPAGRHAALGAGAVRAAALLARDAAGLRRVCRTSTICRSTPTSTRPAARR